MKLGTEVYQAKTYERVTGAIVIVIIIGCTLTLWHFGALIDYGGEPIIYWIIFIGIGAILSLSMLPMCISPSTGGVLFYLGLGHQSCLDGGFISPELSRKLGSNGLSLPEDATVLTVQAGTEWRITGGSRKYLVRKKGNKLSLSEMKVENRHLIIHEGVIFIKPATVVLDENFAAEVVTSDGETAIRIQIYPRPTVPDKVKECFRGTGESDILHVYLPDITGRTVEFNTPAWIDGGKVHDITEQERQEQLRVSQQQEANQ